ncbi:unnamed protein product [Mytilus edulis]|uniref:Uncharacterized protein n=1 Tax=Mytilus edulis TaxID=6550 RepID=A0A8S3SXZ0_MYTED|nr:unnamed protein product [Mytilus edulis]
MLLTEQSISPSPERPDECCASGEEKYLKARLKKKVEETLNIEYREKPLFQLCLNSTTAEHPKGYAQIRSVSQAVVSTANTNLYLIKWDYPPSNRDPDTFLEEVLYDNSNAFYQVKRAGYYHIYSNLVFDFPNNNSTNVTPAESVIRHLVWILIFFNLLKQKYEKKLF